MNRLLTCVICIAAIAIGQIRVSPMGEGAVQEALLLEQKGDLETAQKIYESIYTANPENRQNYNNLKRNYLRQGNYENSAELISKWLDLFPNDVTEQIALGEMFHRMEDPDRASRLWMDIEKQHSKSHHIYQLLFRNYTNLALTKEAQALIQRGRDNLQLPDFMAIDLAHFYDVRRSYDLALEEYILHLKFQPKREKFIQDKVLLMSDEESAVPIIEKILIEHLEDNEKPIRRILAGYYFKLGKFESAVENHLLMGFESAADTDRFLSLASFLRSEKEYTKSMDIYQQILNRSKQSAAVLPQQIGTTLLGMGQTYEQQIVIESRQPQFATYFKDNIFFEDHFYGRPSISSVSLSSTFELYQDILNRNAGLDISPQVHLRLAEIQYRFTRDFDGARLSLNAALSPKIKLHLQQAVYMRLCDILLAEGNPEKCIAFIRNEIPDHIINSSNHAFTIKSIQAYFLSGDASAAQSHLDSILFRLQPNHPYFNDLLEMNDLLSLGNESKNSADSTAFLDYLRAEKLIRQSKLSEAAELLDYIAKQFPQAKITPNAAYREAVIRFSLREPEKVLAVLDRLSGTYFASHALVLKGELFEYIYNDPKEALTHYLAVLEAYPSSLFAEPIRRHVRDINDRLES